MVLSGSDLQIIKFKSEILDNLMKIFEFIIPMKIQILTVCENKEKLADKIEMKIKLNDILSLFSKLESKIKNNSVSNVSLTGFKSKKKSASFDSIQELENSSKSEIEPLNKLIYKDKFEISIQNLLKEKVTSINISLKFLNIKEISDEIISLNFSDISLCDLQETEFNFPENKKLNFVTNSSKKLFTSYKNMNKMYRSKSNEKGISPFKLQTSIDEFFPTNKIKKDDDSLKKKFFGKKKSFLKKIQLKKLNKDDDLGLIIKTEQSGGINSFISSTPGQGFKTAFFDTKMVVSFILIINLE